MKSPTESATSFQEGKIMKGNDNNNWVVKKSSNGSNRWILYESTNLFGFKPLTVDYLCKNIGKTINIYERMYNDEWPKESKLKKDPTYIKWKFTPTGDAGYLNNKKLIIDWLKTQKPPIKDKSVFFIYGDEKSYIKTVQVDSKNKCICSSNLMNTEAFVKID
jgi:hypothetical protein